MNITEKAMLTKLSISQWTAQKLDKKVTQEVATQHNTTTDAGQYRKALIAKDALDKIVKAAGAARTFHYEQTLPWLDDGARILPSANFAAYSAGIRSLRADFDRAVADFIDNYETFVQDARFRLNGLFNADDYPDVDRLARLYRFKHSIDPLPGAEDFRVQLADDEIDMIKAEIEERSRAAAEQGTRDLWRRVRDVVAAMVDRLSQPDAIFKNTLIENARDLVDLLPRLNLADDPALEAARQDIAAKLIGYSPETLRTSTIARAQVAEDAADILKRMAAYCGE